MRLNARRTMTQALAAFVVAIPMLGGCDSPTLPLPPPANPQVVLQGSDAVVTGGDSSAEPHANIICFDQSTGLGSWTDANDQGAYVLTIPAKAGDALECWQRAGGSSSSSVSLVVPP